MSNPRWDFKIGMKEFKTVLKNPRDKRFPLFFARVLSRVPFYDAFHQFITPELFVHYYPKARTLVKTDLLGIGRMPFWEWLYRRLRSK